MYTDQEEAEEAQESRSEYFKKKGNQQFTEEERSAEITIDLVLQARANLSGNKVHGPEDAIVREMIKKLPMEKIYTIARCFQERFMGQMESPESCETSLLEKARCCPEEKNQMLQSKSFDIGDVKLVCKLYPNAL